MLDTKQPTAQLLQCCNSSMIQRSGTRSNGDKIRHRGCAFSKCTQSSCNLWRNCTGGSIANVKTR